MRFRILVALGILIGTFALHDAARAATQAVTYYVDPTQSSLTLSGTYAGEPLLPLLTNDPASLITAYGGTITANRDYVANTLRITGGSISALNALTSIKFGSNNNYLFLVGPVPFGLGAGLFGAETGFSFSVTSPTISSPSSFDAAQVGGAVASGAINYIPGPFPPSQTYSTAMAGSLSMSPGPATLVGSPGSEVLTLPVDTSLTVTLDPYNTGGAPLSLHFSGTIVAGVPEPGTALVLVFSTLGLLIRRRWNGRRIAERA